jgi:hypothetical protein
MKFTHQKCQFINNMAVCIASYEKEKGIDPCLIQFMNLAQD